MHGFWYLPGVLKGMPNAGCSVAVSVAIASCHFALAGLCVYLTPCLSVALPGKLLTLLLSGFFGWSFWPCSWTSRGWTFWSSCWGSQSPESCLVLRGHSVQFVGGCSGQRSLNVDLDTLGFFLFTKLVSSYSVIWSFFWFPALVFFQDQEFHTLEIQLYRVLGLYLTSNINRDQ